MVDRGCTDMMQVFHNDLPKKDLVDTLRRKQKIYKELPVDRSGRDDPIGREFYRQAEERDQLVTFSFNLPNFQSIFSILQPRIRWGIRSTIVGIRGKL